jgi:hypothetical protein
MVPALSINITVEFPIRSNAFGSGSPHCHELNHTDIHFTAALGIAAPTSRACASVCLQLNVQYVHHSV